MQDLMLLLQDTINNNIDIDLAIGEIETAIAESDCKSEILPIYRAIQAYRENKTLDMFGHLRQCMMYFKSSLDITEDMYKQMLEYIDKVLEKQKISLNDNISRDVINYYVKNEHISFQVLHYQDILRKRV